MNDTRFYILLFVFVVIQASSLKIMANKIPNDKIDHINESIKQITLDIQKIKSEQGYSIVQYDGSSANYSKEEIEKSFERILAKLMAKQGANVERGDYADDRENIAASPVDQQAQVISEQEVQTVVSNATLSGYWTAQDTESLLPHLGNLSQQQRNNLIAQFMDAVENKGMQLSSPPPPL